MNNRLVELVVSRSGGKLTITGPKDSSRYPPGKDRVSHILCTELYSLSFVGYAWLWVLADGVPSKGKRVMIGSGASKSFPLTTYRFYKLTAASNHQTPHRPPPHRRTFSRRRLAKSFLPLFSRCDSL
jgi:hypothetical protein